jgi:hypothetical protein
MPKPSADLVKVARPYFAGDKETFATVLLACLMTCYGAAVLEWDPATVEAQVTEDFQATMPPLVYDQLMALINVLATDTVYTSVLVFDHTVGALNRAGAEMHDVPTPEEVAWAVFEITANDPDPYGQGSDAAWPFAPDIARYVGVVLQDAGLRRAPETLTFATMPDWAPSADGGADQVAAAFQDQDELATQVDVHIHTLFEALTRQLAELGLQPASPLLESGADLPEENPLDRLLPG